MVAALEFSLGDAFWSMLWFFLFFMWIWLFITVFADIIRSDDLSGWGKAGWTGFVIVLPYLGVLVYLIARGRSMSERSVREAQARDRAMREYVRDAASAPSTAQEIERLAALQQHGDISAAEYEQAKARILA